MKNASRKVSTGRSSRVSPTRRTFLESESPVGGFDLWADAGKAATESERTTASANAVRSLIAGPFPFPLRRD